MAEDDLISLIAESTNRAASDVLIGIGDDAAVIDVPPGKSLVTCTDTLVAGVHFPDGAPAHSIGFKSLAVNLSDMAAMAAKPRWAQLSLTLPTMDEPWVRDFLAGFMVLADRYNVILVGGDTCAGPLSITVQAMGLADRDKLLTRGTAKAGDLLAVSGELGDAALALMLLRGGQSVHSQLLQRLHEPEPRLRVGSALAGIASSCIDISDGLALDLERLLRSSGCGARVDLEKLPASKHLEKLPDAQRWELQMTGGDDYELCFSVPPKRLPLLENMIRTTAVPVSIIGEVTASAGINCYDENGTVIQLRSSGYQHFENTDAS